MLDIVSFSGLRPGELLVTLLVQSILLITFVLLFLWSVNPLYHLIVGIVYFFHSLTIFLFDIYRIYFCRAVIGFFHFTSIIVLFFVIVLQYSVLYIIIWDFNNEAFSGIPSEVEGIIGRLSIVGLSIYFSTETVTGLGAATIFPSTGAGFFVNWLNTTNSWFFLVFSVTKATNLIDQFQSPAEHRRT